MNCDVHLHHSNYEIFKRQISLAGQCRARTTFQKYPLKEEFKKRLFSAETPQLSSRDNKRVTPNLSFFSKKITKGLLKDVPCGKHLSHFLFRSFWIEYFMGFEGWNLLHFLPFKLSLLAENLVSPNSHWQWKANCLLFSCNRNDRKSVNLPKMLNLIGVIFFFWESCKQDKYVWLVLISVVYCMLSPTHSNKKEEKKSLPATRFTTNV